jgi:F-box protein 21
MNTYLIDYFQIRESLELILQRFVASCPDIDILTPRNKALAVASWLSSNDLTGIDPGREYHSLEHNFLGLALQSPGHNSLPLVSAAIYCFVAQGVGLNAHPCGFPFHVHVIITPQSGLDMNGNILTGGRQGEPLYLDPFRGARETPISDLRSQLTFLGMPSVDQAMTLGEANISSVILRCGKNILNSVRVESQNLGLQAMAIDAVSAKYAALWSGMLLSSDSRPMDLRHQLPRLMELFATDFPSDIFLVEKHIVPLFQGLFEHDRILESLHVMKAVDEIPKQVRRRSGGNTKIRYSVGQVFRHRRYDYKAIITGWDSECGAGEQWMMRMGIDRLEAGRHQSFYHVL